MIVKAEGVIDMADICEVNISHSTQTQNLVHCALWYSKPELASEKRLLILVSKYNLNGVPNQVAGTESGGS